MPLRGLHILERPLSFFPADSPYIGFYWNLSSPLNLSTVDSFYSVTDEKLKNDHKNLISTARSLPD